MKDGLFRKYIVTFMLTILLCTFMLGIALLYFSAQNFTAEKEAALHNAAELGTKIVLEDCNYSSGSLSISEKALERLESLHESTGVAVMISDISGKVLACSDMNPAVCPETVSDRALKIAATRGEYTSAGFLEGLFGHSASYTYGVPVQRDGAIIAFVFALSPMSPLFAFLMDMLVTFLVSSGVMVITSSVVVYYAIRQLTTPLTEISEAATRFGEGDFSARVRVSGEDEMSALADSFNKMADSLSEFENFRRSFVANVSHELRTPMTTIGGYVDGILDGTIPPERQEHYLGIVSSEIKRLSRLTTSQLNVSRIEEGNFKLSLGNFNSWDVMLSVLYSAESRIVEKKIKITDMFVKPRFVTVDNDMLYQIYYNLLDNAIKFTPEGGTITITIEQTGEKNADTVTRIRNTGAGIPASELPSIFGRFYKTDKSRSLDRTGTGLGLYIVKTLVSRLGGKITVESIEGEYTEFALVLHTGAEEKAKSRRVSFPAAGGELMKTVKAKTPEPGAVVRLSKLLGKAFGMDTKNSGASRRGTDKNQTKGKDRKQK